MSSCKINVALLLIQGSNLRSKPLTPSNCPSPTPVLMFHVGFYTGLYIGALTSLWCRKQYAMWHCSDCNVCCLALLCLLHNTVSTWSVVPANIGKGEWRKQWKWPWFCLTLVSLCLLTLMMVIVLCLNEYFALFELCLYPGDIRALMTLTPLKSTFAVSVE